MTFDVILTDLSPICRLRQFGEIPVRRVSVPVFGGGITHDDRTSAVINTSRRHAPEPATDAGVLDPCEDGELPW